MQKRGIFIVAVSIIFNLFVINLTYADTIFYENFSTGFDFTNNVPGWNKSNITTSGRDDILSITGGSDGNYYAWVTGLTGASDQYINKTNISTVGFHNMKISYDYNLQGDFTGLDFLFVEWRLNSGGDWNTIQKTTGLSGWNTVMFDLPSSAANTNIDIRVRENNIDPTDEDTILIDNINISGSQIALCPNGNLDNGEHCDDGNQINSDTCTNNCTITFCGDGTLQQPNGQGTGGPLNDGIEGCDDGNLNNNDTCNNNCDSTAVGACGNNIINTGEQCDDGNIAGGDGCSSACQLEILCGNNIIDQGETCELPNTVDNSFCGQSQQTCQGTKQGTRDAFGNCDSNCGCVDDSFVFQCVAGQCGAVCDTNDDCDDQNSNTIDTCNLNSCGCENIQVIVCGNGIVEFGEQCDDANFNNHDNCLNNCTNPSCGDGFLHVGFEECDDGNLISGDGCNATCKFEPREQCLAPVDVMLVIDKSGSMDDDCPGGQADPGETPCKINDAKNAAITFLTAVNFSKDKVGLASFNELVTLDQGLTNNQALVTAAINALTASGQTDIGGGIKVAREELIANGGDTKAMVLLSDGAPTVNASGLACFGAFRLNNSCAKYALNESNITKLAGIEIFVIGLNVTNLTETLLKQIATTPSNYFSAPNASQLVSIYLQIAQEICPCQGFDCGINSDQCNIGFCDLETDQCDFDPRPESTSCEEDNTKCTTQHCDGEGACVVNDTVEVPEPEQCGSFFCDPADGQVKVNVTGFPLSTLCNTDQNLCTIQHCNGQGQCVVNDTVDVPSPEQCKSFFCDPADGQIKENFTGFPLSTPCEADGNLCTTDHCNGTGGCVKQRDKDCSAFDGQCQRGLCDPGTGACFPDFSLFPFSRPCEAEGNLCTIDHCNGFGSCIFNSSVVVPPPEQCRSFLCNKTTGGIEQNVSAFPLSTFCSTDQNNCTIEHCNGRGQCVINPQAELPPECFGGDAKVSQSQPTTNFGLGDYMIVNPKQGSIDRSYVRIDASSLLNNVTFAILNLTVYQTGGNASGSEIQAWYCKDHDFIETIINWQNQPFNGSCSLADAIIVPNEVIAGIPETQHIFDLLNETNIEISEGDGLFTIVLRSALENTGINHNKKHVQYITRDYSEANFRPKFKVS